MSDYLIMSDEQLLVLCRENKPQALEVLTVRYMKTAKGIASSLGISADEFSDYVQEGMIGFLSAVYSYKDGSQARFSTYAFVCIKNRMLSVLRKASAKGSIPPALTVSLEDSSAQLLDELTPEEQFISEKNTEDILSAIDKLSAQENAVFRLHLAGLSYEEIAEKLSITSKAVDGTLQRARKKLRKSLS